MNAFSVVVKAPSQWRYANIFELVHIIAVTIVLGAFAKFRKATIRCVMSVRPHGATRLPLERFSWHLTFEDFSKIQVSLKSDKNKGYFTRGPKYIFLLHLAHFFVEWEIFQTKNLQKIKTRILCSVTLFRKSCHLWENMEKYCSAGQTTWL